MGKQPKSGGSPRGGKEVRVAATPQPTNGQTIAWQFQRRDMEHPDWGWDARGNEHLELLVRSHLVHVETMTWDELARATGGRSRGNNSHSIPVANLCQDAQERLAALRMDDIDELFSLRLSGELRIWGIRDGRILKVLWYDQDHSVYPVAK